MSVSPLSLTQVTQEREELSGKVQECEEELSMALKELQREQASLKIIKMQNNEVCVEIVFPRVSLCSVGVSKIRTRIFCLPCQIYCVQLVLMISVPELRIVLHVTVIVFPRVKLCSVGVSQIKARAKILLFSLTCHSDCVPRVNLCSVGVSLIRTRAKILLFSLTCQN